MFERRTTCIPTFGIRIGPKLEESNINLDTIATYSVSEVPPWTITRPKVIFDINTSKKSSTDPSLFRSKFVEIKSEYRDFIPIYTDGSRDGDTVAATVTPIGTIQSRLPDMSSIFSAETKAILLALDSIQT